jgi:hypothetical protein
MSGLEVAGIVLAVIPLFISAIEHYEDGLRPLRMMKVVVYRRELARYRTKLTLEYGLYTNALEELLVDVVPQQELRDMITQSQSPLWKDAALNDRLIKRLGIIYDTYFLVMKQMQEVMAKIASLLDIEKQGNVITYGIARKALSLIPLIDHWPSARKPSSRTSTEIQPFSVSAALHHVRVQKKIEVWFQKWTYTTSSRRAQSVQRCNLSIHGEQ